MGAAVSDTVKASAISQLTGVSASGSKTPDSAAQAPFVDKNTVLLPAQLKLAVEVGGFLFIIKILI